MSDADLADDDPLKDALNNDHPEPPAYNPTEYDVPAYDEITSDADLIAYSKRYAAICIAYYDALDDVDVAHIAGWEVSHRAKRRAAAVKHVNLGNVFGGVYSVGLTSPDWDALREEAGSAFDRAGDVDDPKDVVVSLSWKAYEGFDEDKWKASIRHELGHVCQFHQFGATGHGGHFKTLAETLSTTQHCEQFEPFKYRFICRDCNEQFGGRYRESKYVRFARMSEEEQGEWIRNNKRYIRSPCCDALPTTDD